MLTKKDREMLEDFKWEYLTEREKGYIIGLFVADGNIFISKKLRIYRVRFYLSKTDDKVLEKLLSILKKLFAKHKIAIYTDKNCLVIEVHSKTFVKEIRTIVKKDKCLKTLEFSTEFLKGFIEGMIDGDGYISWNNAQVVTANLNLRKQIEKILEKLEIKSRIYTASSLWSSKIIWRIYFHYKGIFEVMKVK